MPGHHNQQGTEQGYGTGGMGGAGQQGYGQQSMGQQGYGNEHQVGGALRCPIICASSDPAAHIIGNALDLW